ncbi:MAG: NUDIX hydrolase [Beutenbergiaceae bacterium]
MPAPAFITELRTKVGHDLLWLSGATAVVLDSSGRVLLGQRSDNHQWSLISGILDPGEQPDHGVAREVLEETGVTVMVEALAAVRVTDPMTYPNGDQAQFLDLIFLCRPHAGTAWVADDESVAVGWFSLDALPHPLLAHVRPTLENVLNYRADPAAGVRWQR